MKLLQTLSEILLVALFLIPAPLRVIAQTSPPTPTFNENSHVLTNHYFPWTVGRRLEYTGLGTLSGQSYSLEALAKEEVSGINCVKLHLKSSFVGDSVTWMAQDAEGNVWKIRDDDCEEVGLFMPAAPALEQTITVGYCFGTIQQTVLELNASVSTPFRDFTHCLVLTENQAFVVTDTSYAPDWGMVAVSYSGQFVDSGFYLSAVTTGGIPEQEPEYTVIDLGTLGGEASGATGINDSGQVVGSSKTSSGYRHAFLYSNGVMQDLGTLGGNDSVADGINDSGQVVGWSWTGNTEHAFLYGKGVMQDLGTLGGDDSVALGINDSGQVVGWSHTTGTTIVHAFLYSSGIMQDLGTLGGNYSVARGINDISQVVGESQRRNSSYYHAFLYSNGIMQDLGTLGGDDSVADGINDSGQVVGSSATTRNTMWRNFLYSNGIMQDLGTLGGENSVAYRINDSGQVVGWSQITGDASYHAFLYANGSMQDLNDLIDPASGWLLKSANAINNAGQIVGSGSNPSGHAHAFLLNPLSLGPSLKPALIRGRVVAAPLQQPLPAVVIQAIQDGNAKAIGNSDSFGNYEFKQLAPGVYTLKASKDGFATAVKFPLELAEGEERSMDIVLRSVATLPAQKERSVEINHERGAGQTAALGISIPTMPDRTYVLEYKDSLSDSFWKVLRWLIGEGGFTTFLDKPGNSQQRFYRIRVEGSDSAKFDYPLGPPYRLLGTALSPIRDGDGWYVEQDFGEPNPEAAGKKHLGEDWNSEHGPSDDLGKPVFTAASGTVIYAENPGKTWNGVIVIQHLAPQGKNFLLPGGGTASEVWTVYGHLDAERLHEWVDAAEKKKVVRNKQIGVIGPTPEKSSGPHLHFEVRTQNPTNLEGPGYSFDTSGWIDPSAFIELNRAER